MRLLWIQANHIPGSQTVEPSSPDATLLPKRMEALAERLGMELILAASAHAAVEFASGRRYDVALASFPLAGWSPEEMVEELLRHNAAAPVIIHHDSLDIDAAVRLARLGVFDLLSTFDPEQEWHEHLERAVEHRRSRSLAALAGAVFDEPWRRFLVGESRKMQQVSEIIRLVGKRRCTVLISGETGTGKELAARAIHDASDRRCMPLVAVNCSALPESLLESELFGHVKGAFTGATGNRIGRFEQANRGTLFLDEVGDLPLELQAKLLRVLQEREFQRLGSSDTIKVDVRVVAATNIDLVEKIRRREFREDLYYRLNVVPIYMPPLHDRRGDIPVLVHHFIEKVCRQEHLPARRIAPETLRRLAQFEWPGNVRQLENAIEMAVVMSGERTDLLPSDFPFPAPSEGKPVILDQVPRISVPDEGLDFEEIVSSIERDILEQALQKTGGNKKLAAEMLRLKRTTLTAKLKSLEAVIV
jgi:DNA-binding NtrC family response regulator